MCWTSRKKKFNPYSNSSSIDISSQTVRDTIVWMADGDGQAVSVRWQPPAHCSVPAFRIVAKQIVVGPAKVAAAPLGGKTYCLFWRISNDSFPLPATAKHWLEISWRFPQREKKKPVQLIRVGKLRLSPRDAIIISPLNHRHSDEVYQVHPNGTNLDLGSPETRMP